jgi:hypothetical protein
VYGGSCWGVCQLHPYSNPFFLFPPTNPRSDRESRILERVFYFNGEIEPYALQGRHSRVCASRRDQLLA